MHFRGLKLACTYFPRQFLHSAFSTSEQNAQILKPLSDSAQKAIWAQHVIQSIMTLRPATSINDKSLREKIIELKLQNTGYKLNDENRQEVLKMFKEGIWINEHVYDQTRVKKAIRTIIKPNKKGPIIFCPNYSVTRQIFEILNDPSTNSLILGGYGISKTIGIIMFSQLVLFKAKFMMEAKNDTVKKKEMENLSNKKLIDIDNTSKCWYWSIDQEKLVASKDKKEYQFIRKLLLMQATELSKQQIEYFQKIESYQQFSAQLKDTYQQAKIPQLVIFDQINSVASRMRQVNSIIYQREKIIKQLKQRYRQRTFKDENQKQKIYREYDAIIQIYRQKIKQKDSTCKDVEYLLKYINQLKKYGRSYKFNSSINFQIDYLKLKKLVPYQDMLCFNVSGGHKQFFFNKIDYQRTLLTTPGKIDFYHFLWFQISRLLLDANVSVKNLEKIKEQIYQSIQKQIKVKSYYRIIFINQIFKDYAAKIKQINQETNQQTILKIFNEIVLNFDSECKLKIERIIIDFMSKKKEALQKLDDKNHNKIMKQIQQNLNKDLQLNVDIQKKEQFQPFNLNLIKLLYELAENDIRMGKKQMSYSISDLQKLMESNIVSLVTSKIHDNQALPVDIDQKLQKIHFLWDPQQFMQIVKRIVDPIKQDFYSEFWNKNLLERSKQNKSTSGTSIQSAFIKVLIPNTIIQFFTFTHEKATRKQNIYQPEHYSQLQIQIFKKFDYLSLKKDSDFFKDMEKILQSSKENPGKWFSGIPSKERITIPQRQNLQQMSFYEKIVERDNYSPSIDFLFVRFDQERKIHQIQSFDMSVGFNLTNKRNQFKQLLNEIVQNEVNIEKGLKLSITHNVLCHEDEMRPAEYIKLPLQKKKREVKKKEEKIKNTLKKQSEVIPQLETFLIDNKIRVCFSSLDQIKVLRCFESTAYKSFKYLHRWLCENRGSQIRQHKINKILLKQKNNQKKK